MAKSLNQYSVQVINFCKNNLNKKDGKQLESLVTKALLNSTKTKKTNTSSKELDSKDDVKATDSNTKTVETTATDKAETTATDKAEDTTKVETKVEAKVEAKVDTSK
jgi:hypothetical protein